MNIPALPTIPTDSLHRFLAITGLLLIILPNIYLDAQMEKTGLNIIHIEAEQDILAVQSKELERKTNALEILAYGKVLAGLPPKRIQAIKDSVLMVDKNQIRTITKQFAIASPKKRQQAFDSLMKTGHFVAMDTLSRETNKLRKLTLEEKITNIQFNEKVKIARFQVNRLTRYFTYAISFFMIGIVMAIIGFTTWYQKENATNS